MGVLEAAQLVNLFKAKMNFSMHTFPLYMSWENNLVFYMFKKKYEKLKYTDAQNWYIKI